MSPNDKYADPTLDWSFKRIFLSPGHKPILKAFLNDVLQGELVVEEILDHHTVEKLESLGKKIIYDIHCKSTEGELFIIEMQRDSEPEFFKRLDYYRGRALSGQIQTAQDYLKILPVILVTICDFNVIDNIFNKKTSGVYFEKIYYTGSQTKERIPGPPQFIFLDLKQYKKQGFPTNSYLEDWFQLFSCKAIPHELSIQRKEVKKALDDLKMDHLSLEEKAIVEKEGLDKTRRHEELKGAIDQAKQEGLDKGLEQGKIEAKRESAINLLKEGIDQKIIAKCTGLTLEEVKKLSKEKN